MATMKDVAREAGVSLGTVSRVINHAAGIKPATLEKVKAAIEKLNYVPDQYARGMKLNRSYTVALMVPTIWNSFNAEFAYHIEHELAKRDYKMLVCDYDDDPQRELAYIQMVKENKIDAIIAITYGDLEKYINFDLPFISIDRYYEESVSYVASENYQGGRLAAEELLKHGAEHPAYIGSYNCFPNDTMKRYDGFKDVMKEKGLPLLGIHELEPVADFQPLLNQLLDENPQIDAFFCNTDTLLYDVSDWLSERGLRVPEDIQLIGYDGMRLDKSHRIPVSTIAQPLEEMAKKAVELALAKIENPDMPAQAVYLPVTFLEGNTTKK
ncbi:LacI family transcriptional regulator [Lactobacillus delbrueckii]|uniref:LacI family transcriptional regulator n=1 Tax=Lactobacillus delbrueckii TaxID=1584 RepID=A0ABD0AEH7_9LACO|nr:LacI family DNA-binding transcriptional regulator [Lactobacillus delbrueckii]GHN18024.1 LacI family transcriptional regulator [Lactobacillus delbrueckii]GHN33500.1 LacI family transcriptional regulator [Lactobacillus delbrueckii]GHN41942.1 LacI family transcriptional regulator [Lactobacillus delbrueckii]